MNLDRVFDSFGARDWQTVEEGTVRFAMIGLGWWVLDEAMPAVESADLCETTVVVSSSKEKARRVAAGHDSVTAGLTYAEFHEGEAAGAYDAVYVCTPNALHLPYVETAAELEKDVLCEKPMEASVERAAEMVEVCEDAGVTLMIAYRMQTDPAIRCARRLVEEGFVGDPAHVHGHMSQRLLDIIADPDQWRLDPELAGEGASVTDLGVYPLNTTRFVLDEDPERVQAFTHSSDREGFEDVPDERAAFTLEFPGGTYASCSASQHAHQSGLLRITGTEGEIALEPAFFNRTGRALSLSRGGSGSIATGGVEADVTFDPVDQMEAEFEYFANQLLAGEEPHADGRHGLFDMKAIEAVYEAGETGNVIPIE